jgi:hypothetical protein
LEDVYKMVAFLEKYLWNDHYRFSNRFLLLWC